MNWDFMTDGTAGTSPVMPAVSVSLVLVFSPVAGGFAALVLREIPLAYSSLATPGAMSQLIVLVLRFKKKARPWARPPT